MTGGSTGLRLRHAVDRELWLVVGLALVLVLAGGWLTYDAYGSQDQRLEERTVSSWESTGAFEHRATAINGTPIFDEGSVLSNREVYFTTVTPVLNGTFAYGYTSEEGSIDATVALSFVTRSAAEQRRDGEIEYWRVSEPVGTANGTIAPGERVSVPFSVNVSAAALRAEATEEQLGGTPGEIQHLLLATVDLEGTRNGAPVDATREYRLPMRTEQGVYRLSDPGQVLANGSQTEQYAVPVEPGALGAVGGPLAMLAGLGAILTILLGRAIGTLPLDETERERLVHARERDEFDEWITVARTGVDVGDAATVDVDSLSGLVDFAIDSEERVVETPSGTYVVRHDGMVYTYMPPAAEEAPGSVDEPTAGAPGSTGGQTAGGGGRPDRTDGEPGEGETASGASGNGAPDEGSGDERAERSS